MELSGMEKRKSKAEESQAGVESSGSSCVSVSVGGAAKRSSREAEESDAGSDREEADQSKAVVSDGSLVGANQSEEAAPEDSLAEENQSMGA